MKCFLLGVLSTVVVCVSGVWFALARGYVDFAADQPPSSVETHLAMSAVDASTQRRAPQRTDPVAATEENITRGAKIYLDHCAGCHGVPSNPDSPFARSFYPHVPGFFQEAPDMSEPENFYIIQHGIRWTGMPAWQQTLSDLEIWQVVTFLGHIEQLPPGARGIFEADTQPASRHR
jgi:mono/diheme cytochrome c family protein